MAKIFYEVRQNKNVKSSVKDKWFAHSKSIETMNTRKLAKHISEHGSVYTTDVVFGVLEKFRSCLVEMLSIPPSRGVLMIFAPSALRRVCFSCENFVGTTKII